MWRAELAQCLAQSHPISLTWELVERQIHQLPQISESESLWWGPAENPRWRLHQINLFTSTLSIWIKLRNTTHLWLDQSHHQRGQLLTPASQFTKYWACLSAPKPPHTLTAATTAEQYSYIFHIWEETTGSESWTTLPTVLSSKWRERAWNPGLLSFLLFPSCSLCPVEVRLRKTPKVQNPWVDSPWLNASRGADKLRIAQHQV